MHALSAPPPLLLPTAAALVCCLQGLQQQLQMLEKAQKDSSETKHQVGIRVRHQPHVLPAPACSLARLPACLPACLCLPCFLAVCLPACLPACLPTCVAHTASISCLSWPCLSCPALPCQVDDMLAYHRGKAKEAELAAQLESVNAAQGTVSAGGGRQGWGLH